MVRSAIVELAVVYEMDSLFPRGSLPYAEPEREHHCIRAVGDAVAWLTKHYCTLGCPRSHELTTSKALVNRIKGMSW